MASAVLLRQLYSHNITLPLDDIDLVVSYEEVLSRLSILTRMPGLAGVDGQSRLARVLREATELPALLSSTSTGLALDATSRVMLRAAAFGDELGWLQPTMVGQM